MSLRPYCLAFKDTQTMLVQKKIITTTNKVIRDKSRCAECFSGKSRFMKQNYNKKIGQ